MRGYIRSKNIVIDKLKIILYEQGNPTNQYYDKIIVAEDQIDFQHFIAFKNKIYVRGYYEIEFKKESKILAEQFIFGAFKRMNPTNIVCHGMVQPFSIELFRDV